MGWQLLCLNRVTSLPSPVLMKLASDVRNSGLLLQSAANQRMSGDSRICNVAKAAAAGRVWLHDESGQKGHTMLKIDNIIRNSELSEFTN